MVPNEPVRHHYIPQFLLRNFSCDQGRHLHYFSKIDGKDQIREIRETFMERNLYRDNINYPELPTQIEHDLARYEHEVSTLLCTHFMDGRAINITLEEHERLILFFAVMGFRSLGTEKQFAETMSRTGKKFYRRYQYNRDYIDLWKRNLGYIVNCRSMAEIAAHPDIDEPFKLFFFRDTVGITGKYLVVAERKGLVSFVIGDTYPVLISGELPNGLELPVYSICPISPDRVILIVNNGADGEPDSVLNFRKIVLDPPILCGDSQTLKIVVKRLEDSEVNYFNSLLIKEASCGFAHRSEEIPQLPDICEV